MANYKGIELPDDLYYDPKEHIWTRVEDGRAKVGVDMFGMKAAGAVQYVKMRPAGSKVVKGKAFGSIEAGKYIGPLRAPVNGTLLELNQKVLDKPALMNEDPYGEGFLAVIEPTSLEEDLKDRVAGADNIQKWLEAEYNSYLEKGMIKEE
jgi:glycine cleavage system H protein